MRASLKGKEDQIIEEKKYRGLPLDLRPYYVYLKELGHCVLCVPQMYWRRGIRDFTEYEVPIPINFVMNHVYAMKDGFVFVNVPCEDKDHLHLHLADFVF